MRRFKPYMVGFCAMAIALGAFPVRDRLARKYAFAERTACAGALARLPIAQELYASEHGLTNGAFIPDDLVRRENGMAERSVSGGHCSINPMGVLPACSCSGGVRCPL
jgi:hypothetical protein